MIERIIRNEETLKKWRTFKKRKTSYFSIWMILLACFFSFTAEFWANSKPLYLSYQSKSFFPVFKEYSVKEFGITDSMQVDFRKLKLSQGDIIIWPLINWDPYESNKKVNEYPAPPSSSNLMGTDDRGRDVLTRLLYGLRYSIIYAVGVWILTFMLATIFGGLQGYFGGRVDLFGQRITEVLSSVPYLFLLIILISVFKPTLGLLIIITTFLGWIGISYYVRAEFLKNRKMEYVEAARSLGAGHMRIFFRHILPNSLTPLITFTPFTIAGYITALAGLDYLGFGLTPPTPSWGELLNQAHKNFTTAWWLVLYPFLALTSLLTLFNLIGDGVRDAMDPRKRSL